MDRCANRPRAGSPRWKQQAGMTLIEVTLATGVMALTLSLLFGSLVNMKSLGDITRDGTRATMVLENTLELVRTISPSNLMASNLSVTDGPGVSRTIQVKVVNGSGTWITLPSASTAIGTMPNPVEVQVTIIWRDERGHVFSRSASTKVPR